MNKVDKLSNAVYRFAPSPTGYLHIGGARTALFNWLLARKTGGKFLLRIEDTDRERSTRQSTEQILGSLRWLGLEWDGPPVYQSQRGDIYRETAQILLEAGKAYRCFCTPATLARERQAAEKSGGAFLYDGRCRHLSGKEIDERLKKQESFALRLIVSEGETRFNDGVRGSVTVQHRELDDFIILRSDKSAIYHLAVVVDDHQMGVTHVVRGDDHLSNTPKQILIYRALGWEEPAFAHLPLIHGPDGARLSKRHGAASVEEFRDSGYLPEAVFNYLCLLGWATGDDREILSRDETIDLFTLERVNKKNAVFDTRKLLWVNGKYLSMAPAGRLIKLLGPLLSTEEKEIVSKSRKAFTSLIDLAKSRAQTIPELYQSLRFFFHDPKHYDEKGVEKYFKSDKSRELLHAEYEFLEKRNSFDPSQTETALREFADQLNIKAAELIHPLRLALTGETASPGIFDVLMVLGKEAVLRRVKKALIFTEKLMIPSNGESNENKGSRPAR
jgi:glutamyl-tRNA synthetase